MNPLLLLIGGALALFAMLPKRAESAAVSSSLDTSPAIPESATINYESQLTALLATIRWAEGTERESNPYAVTYGYGDEISDFTDHPALTGEMSPKDGPDGATTAAGAYQIVATTWKDLGGADRFGSFDSAAQDAAAVALIERRRGVKEALERGDFDTVLSRLSYEWASLPPARYNQSTRSKSEVVSYFQSQGGVVV